MAVEKVNEKAAKVQRKTLKDLHKTWRTIAQDHFERLQQTLDPWRQNIKKRGMAQNVCTVQYMI